MTIDKEVDGSPPDEKQAKYLAIRQCVLARIVAGERPRVIASNLGMSLGKTFMYVQHIREKYGGKTYEELVQNILNAEHAPRQTDA